MKTGVKELEEMGVPYYRNAKVGDDCGFGDSPFPQLKGHYDTHRWGELQSYCLGTAKPGDLIGGDVCVLSVFNEGDASWPSSHEVIVVPAQYTVRKDVQDFIEKYRTW